MIHKRLRHSCPQVADRQAGKRLHIPQHLYRHLIVAAKVYGKLIICQAPCSTLYGHYPLLILTATL